MFGDRFDIVRVVRAPDEEELASKLPVEIARTVPAGLLLRSRLTVADVAYIAKLKTPGSADNVDVDPVTITAFVAPSTSRTPACRP